MRALVYYISLPFLYLVALLPYWLLYGFSDFVCFILKDVFGYRKGVIVKNFTNSFPEKTEKEIKKLTSDYYHYLCDLILETFKTLTMSAKEARERCVFHNTDWLDQLHKENKSLVIVMGHYGNWEWAGPSFTLYTKYQLVVIYRPLSNIYFERLTTKMRTKFGTKIAPAANTLREMVANRNSVTATAFIADQTAFPEFAYWTTFLNQDTAVFNGPEKLAKKFNYPVVYMSVRRRKRGYYDVYPELLFTEPAKTQENEILEVFTRRLEKEIVAAPTTWLWSHKRWKYKKPSETVS